MKYEPPDTRIQLPPERLSTPPVHEFHKCDQTEIDRRVGEVLQLLLAGALHHDILQHAAAQKWGVKDRQVRNYIAAAKEQLADAIREERSQVIARHLALRRSLYARCVAVAEHAVALAVLRDEANLLGLYPARGKATDQYDPAASVRDMTDDQLADIIASDPR